MGSKNESVENLLTLAFNKWWNKKWFQVLFSVIVILCLVLIPIIHPIITSIINEEKIIKAVEESLEEKREQDIKNHKQAFEYSKQCHAIAKTTMNEFLDKIDCDYMFLIEYHNGSENIATGIQFCRFDVPLEAIRDGFSYIPKEKFNDDMVTRYDILLSNELNKNSVCTYSKYEFNKVDKYLAHQLDFIDAQSYAIANLKDKDGTIFGSLLCVTTKENPMNIINIYECIRELECIFQKK
jgi:hypothetical protein